MRITIDLNVLLDVAQGRAEFYRDSEEVLARAREGEFEGVLPGHGVTTFHYIVAKFAGVGVANAAVDGLLADFAVAGADKAILRRARSLSMADFEDAVVAAVAEANACDFIVTRNTPDFAASPVRAVTPTRLLKTLRSK